METEFDDQRVGYQPGDGQALRDKLRDAIFEIARANLERETRHDANQSALLPNGTVIGQTEQRRRQASLAWVDELLEWRPLSAFSAVQLEFLELLIAYWRECEDEVAGVPEPDPLPPQQ